MRFMVIVQADPKDETNYGPTEQELADMGKFNEELVKAGVMLAGEGLLPSSTGVRVRFEGDKRTVIDGPFTESKEVVAGFWIWQCRSKEEAIEWAKRIPGTRPDQPGQIELRQVAEAEDFGDAYTPEVREQEDRLRAQLEKGQQR